MSEKETSKIRRWFSKSYNEDKEIPYAWFNTLYFKLTERGIQEFKDYIVKRPYIREIIIINNIETTRPQRTMGDMPEWFRPSSEYNHFDNYDHNNSFIFIIYSNEYKDEEIEEALKSFPSKTEMHRIKRN